MIKVDLEEGEVTVEEGADAVTYPINSPEAFGVLSRAWLRAGWDTKYVYSFTWLGRPVIQLPEDLIRLQEVIFAVRPDVIIETGVAHGGGLVFYATLCQALGHGRVIGVDIEIRPHNRAALEGHKLAPFITLVEGDSAAQEVVAEVRSHVREGESALVLLDGCHTRDHVRAELEAYGPLVGPGSYLVAMDGIKQDLKGAPRSEEDWDWNNPATAAREFAEAHPEFVLEDPPFAFNEACITERVTYWPNAFLKRLGDLDARL